MANQSLFKKPIFWAAVVALGAAGYFLTEPEASKSSGIKPAARKKSAKAALTGSVVFTKEDELATFNPVSQPVGDGFRPIIARKGGIGGGDGMANSVPAEFAGGEANWIYTGSAEINGVTSALIENRSTGEGVFLKRGERWKSSAVLSIGSRSVVLRGPSGPKTLSMIEDEAAPRMASAGGGMSSMNNPNPNGFAPVNPGIRGPIGSLPSPSGNGASIAVAPGGAPAALPGISMEQGDMNNGN